MGTISANVLAVPGAPGGRGNIHGNVIKWSNGYMWTRGDGKASTVRPGLNPKLVSYWDDDSCGPQGNDYNRDWCSGTSFQCKAQVQVPTTTCPSGFAKLISTQGSGQCCRSVIINGCGYAFFAQYACSEASAKAPVAAPAQAPGTVLIYDDKPTPSKQSPAQPPHPAAPTRPPTPSPTPPPGPKTYLPVFMMHGLGTGVEDFDQLAPLIERVHPGTVVHVIPLFQMKDSYKALQTQVETVSGYIRAVVQQNPATYQNGYNMVCYSQGGLLCRALIEFMDDHNVHTFISMAAPHMGVYGPEFFKAVIKDPFWQKFTLDNVWMVASNWIAQSTLSIANLWHDPMHPTATPNGFLPKYNNLLNDPEGNAKRKANFVRLQKAVFLAGLMGGANWDGSVQPSCSGVFEYYTEGSTTEFTPMKLQQVYTQDTFGLRTLDDSGRLEVHAAPMVFHQDWVREEHVAREYIIPHLN